MAGDPPKKKARPRRGPRQVAEIDRDRFNPKLLLRLKSNGSEIAKINGGRIKLFDLQLASHGWSGVIEFIQAREDQLGEKRKDKVWPYFLKSEILEVELDIESGVEDGRKLLPPLTLRGIVTKRSVREIQSRELKFGVQMTRRCYRIEVADPARVLWGQHHPCKLYAEKSMGYVIKEHCNSRIKFKDAFAWADQKRYKPPLIFFALDRSIGKASFYDFVLWYVDRHRLVWNYDLRTNEYSISEAKEPSKAEPIEILITDVDDYAEHATPPPLGKRTAKLPQGAPARFRWLGYQYGLRIDVPEVPRYQPVVLDSFTGSEIPKKEVENEYKEEKIVAHTLLRTAIVREVEERWDFEKKRLAPKPNPEVTVRFAVVPTQLVFPGDLVKLPIRDGQWSSDTWQNDHQSMRVFAVRLAGDAINEGTDDEMESETNAYVAFYEAKLELAEDLTTCRLPPFVEPTYPVHVEGKIMSDIGPDTAETYDEKEDKDGLYRYRVEVPLWKDTAPEILVPYNPGRMPGQLFFPAYKHERVLLALTWRKGWIDGFLDWRQDVRVHERSQGNHMLLGKNPTSRTSVVHFYENPNLAKPVFQIVRTNDVDLQRIRISEGNLLIKVTESEEAQPLLVLEDADENKQD